MAIKYTLEDVEYLRGKAGISYEEAVALLEKYDGDMTRALVELEKRGKLSSGRNRNKRPHEHGGGGFARLLSLGVTTHVVVTRKGKLLADLPVLYLLFVTIVAVWVPAISLVLMLFSGCRIKVRRGHTDYTERDLRAFMTKAADNIRESVSGFAAEADAQQEEPERPFRAGGDAEGTKEQDTTKKSDAPFTPEPDTQFTPSAPDAPAPAPEAEPPTEPIPHPTQVEEEYDDDDEGNGFHKITIE